MPRPKKPARLYRRPDTEEWVIRGLPDGRERRTGFTGSNGRVAAERALARALIEYDGQSPSPADGLPIATALLRYAKDRGSQVAKPALIADAIDALGVWWAGKTVADISPSMIAAYVAWRCGGGLRAAGRSGSRAAISQSTARRDLTTLRAAVRHAHKVKLLTEPPPVVELPPEGRPRDRALTRNEAAAILRELWRGPFTTARDGSRHRAPNKSRHAARLFWLLLFTGSRFNAVAKATREPRKDGPWVDSGRGLWHRAGDDERKTKKRRRPHAIPGTILLALGRWERLFPDQVYVVERAGWPRRPVGDIGAALEAACARAGVPRVVPHDLKHTSITWFIASGGDPVMAAEYYSTTYKTIADNYLHLSPDYQRGAFPVLRGMGKQRTETHRNRRK